MKKFEKVLYEYFDIDDFKTLNTMLCIDEADKSTVLNSLTSNLYHAIMEKVDKIDFGSIPASKGDITLIENYDKLIECIEVIKSILIEFDQSLDKIGIIELAIQNVKDRKALFGKGFAFNLSMPILIYNSTVLSIIAAISLLISTSIEYIKDAGDKTFDYKFDAVSYAKTKDSLLFKNLQNFNTIAENGELDNSLNYAIEQGSKQLLGVTSLTVVNVIAIVGLILSVIPIMRELIFYFYHAKQSISDYFDVQADLLLINSEYVKNNVISNKTEKERREISRKQAEIANKFKKISTAMQVDNKVAENKAKKDASAMNRKYKVEELVDDKLDSLESTPGVTTSSIF